MTKCYKLQVSREHLKPFSIGTQKTSSCRDNDVKIPTVYRKTMDTHHTKQQTAKASSSSVVAQGLPNELVPVYLAHKCTIPAGHEVTAQVLTHVKPKYSGVWYSDMHRTQNRYEKELK